MPPPPPVQQPRTKSMQRVLRCDGLLPVKMNAAGKFAEVTPDDIRHMKAFIEENRTLKTSFDIAWEGETPGRDRKQAASKVRPWAEAGVTWWIETRWQEPRNAEGLKTILKRIKQGPPRID